MQAYSAAFRARGTDCRNKPTAQSRPELDGGRRTIGEIASLLGVTRQTLHRVIAGKTAVTPDMAVRLGKLCGNGPGLWLRMQAAYDASEATRRLGKELEKIPTLS